MLKGYSYSAICQDLGTLKCEVNANCSNWNLNVVRLYYFRRRYVISLSYTFCMVIQKEKKKKNNPEAEYFFPTTVYAKQFKWNSIIKISLFAPHLKDLVSICKNVFTFLYKSLCTYDSLVLIKLILKWFLFYTHFTPN